MKKAKFSHKVIAVFLTLNFLTSIIPINYLFASTNGPGSPEAAGFEPVDASDMVSLATGDMSYVLPLLSIDGFPLNLSYHAGITTDLDASWVGLGWYLNPGAINRSLTNTPDDWKDGIGIDFTSYEETDVYYGITADVGFASTAQVGVGINWGAGKGVSGSVRAMAGFAIGDMVNAGVTASADTNGNVSVGVTADVSVGGIKGGASYSYSITGKNGSFSVGINAGLVSAGASFNSDGYSVNYTAGGSSNVGIGSGSFNSGDMSIDTDTFAIAIPVYFFGISFTLGFSKKKVKYSLRKGFVNHDWGALYASDFNAMTSGGSLANNAHGLSDYQKRTKSYDVYSTRIPQAEEDFVGDYSKDIENINFTTVGYDGYNVNAQGINGFMTPRLFQNITVFGKGDRTQNEQGDDVHVFWHHGASGAHNNVAQREFGGGNNQLYFYFDGHLTSRETVVNSAVNNQSTKSNINSYVKNGGLTSNYSLSNPYKRAKSPNYVEVFTNSQIADDNGINVKSKGLIIPSNETHSNRGSSAHFDPNGIGAYKITSADGKTYHFSLPVYQFEMVQRSLIEEDESSPGVASNVSEKRQYSKYATHWLLTAVTGSDYIDTNNNGKVDTEDYGYWVELDYGKWSDGFVWRNPHNSHVNNYNTNLLNDVASGDKGYYQFGRKQLYYLDQIKTRNKTAVFVKSMRYDAVGKALNFRLDGDFNNGYLDTSGNNSALNETGNIHVGETGVSYQREYSLKLDKIVVFQTDVANQLSKESSSTLGAGLNGYIKDHVNVSTGWSSPDFVTAYGPDYRYSLHNESLVFDINDVSESFINQKALKVIEMEYDYSLAENSDSSSELPSNLTGGTHGKLTLTGVEFKGKGGSSYMPPYRFEYYLNDSSNPANNLENIPLTSFGGNIPQYIEAKRNSIDNWGFLKGVTNSGEEKVKAWSLKQITTPTGAEIEIDYEKDDYWIEAFGRRYWQDNLYIHTHKLGNGDAEITIQNQSGISPNAWIDDFGDYFIEGERVFFDYWVARRKKGSITSNNEYGSINIPKDKIVSVHQVSQNQVVLRVPWFNDLYGGDDESRAQDRFFCKTNGCGSNVFYDGHRGYVPSAEYAGDDHHTMLYKLLANKVPEDETGGGLRVKSLKTTDVTTNTNYLVDYNYNYPEGHPTRGGMSSGITSYTPVDGLKYVPYQSELPSPGVMYEYVTMTEMDANGDYDFQTRFRHHVLKPVYDIFDPNIRMEALDADAQGEDDIFWASVEDNYGGLNGSGTYNSGNKKVKAKTIDLHINTALIGQIKSIEKLNRQGHVIFKKENEYINGTNLTSKPNKGYVRESFNSMKTIFKTDTDGNMNDPNYTKRLLSISTKTEYSNMLSKVTTYAGNQKSTVEFKDVDPWLGSFRESISTLSDGTFKKDIRIPAYNFYNATGEMASKTEHPSNKNMLSQEALSISQISADGYNYETINASINTWNDTWSYRDVAGNQSNANTEVPVWRKHKTFIWKDNVKEDGTYATSITEYNNLFDWGIGEPIDNKWQNVSEVTRYTHWSSPLESKDINDNHVSSKMADTDTKVVASGNARFTEMFYSGAEYDIDGTYLDQEIKGAQNRTTLHAHTGKYSLQLIDTQPVFETKLKANEHDKNRYRISVWVLKIDDINPMRLPAPTNDNDMSININGTSQAFNGETVSAGNWTQLNHYAYLDETEQIISINSSNNQYSTYVDDFRIHPVHTSMNSYVYDNETDELTYILDANNMATKYIYDKAGRLCKLYKEIETNLPETEGGFKLVNQYKYHYKDLDTANNCYCCEDGGNTGQSPMYIKNLSQDNKGDYVRVFTADAQGGANNYSYEWRWLIDYETNTFSDFISGLPKQDVPFAAEICDYKNSTYNKIWKVEVKVTDNVTGESTSKMEEVKIKDCKFILNDDKWADIEISTNYNACNALTKYTFRPFVIKPSNNDYSYSYRTYNHLSNEWTSYSIINNDKNTFCGDVYFVPSTECSSTYSIYQTLQYRIIDNVTGVLFESNALDVYLDCVENPINNLKLPSNSDHIKYNKFGNVVKKNSSGEIINVYNMTGK